MAASAANDGRVSWPLPHQKATRWRGAASPRSASPMGPAPTRLPRMAFPPPAMCDSLSVLVGQDQAQPDDAGEPDHADADGEPVEVALGHRGSAERAGDTASEHVRET